MLAISKEGISQQMAPQSLVVSSTGIWTAVPTPATAGSSHTTTSTSTKPKKINISKVGKGQGQDEGEGESSTGQGQSGGEEGEGYNEGEETEDNSDNEISDADKMDANDETKPPLDGMHALLKNFTLYDDSGAKLDTTLGILLWGSWVPAQFECTTCLRLEKSWRSALEHWEQHQPLYRLKPEVFICELCGKRSTHIKYHASHLAKCKKKLDCPLCDFCVDPKEFERYKLVLKAHRLEKHPQAKLAKKHLCEECGEAFECSAHLKEHFNEIHDPNPTLFKCPFCDEKFKSSRKLRFHKRYKHCDKKSLACPECQHTFCRDEALKLHVDRVHRKVKNHKCTYEGCDAEFFNTKGLRSHIDNRHLHLPATLPCTWKGCNKMFRNDYNLKIHMRVHTDEKPLKCPHCDYCARQRAAMNWHMKKHAPNDEPDVMGALQCEEEPSTSQSEYQSESLGQSGTSPGGDVLAPLEGGISTFRGDVQEPMEDSTIWGGSPEKKPRVEMYPGFPSYHGYM
jgi:hypothetical protein